MLSKGLTGSQWLWGSQGALLAGGAQGANVRLAIKGSRGWGSGQSCNSLAHKSVCQNPPRASSEPESASSSGWSCWSPATVPPNTTAFPLCTPSRRHRAGSLQLLRTPPRNIFRESCEILSIFIAKLEQQRGWNVGEVCLHVFTLNNFVRLGRPGRDSRWC